MTGAKEPQVETYYEPTTGTWQYLVIDPTTKEAAIIDSVLDYDPGQRLISTKTADNLLDQVKQHGVIVTHILETHAHADHLTASRYLQKNLEEKYGRRPSICIGRRIKDVQDFFAARYGIPKTELDSAFDKTFEDNEKFKIGELNAEVLYLPGHTPDHIGYVIGSCVFTGDSIFNPDVGSARCDFPGGSAETLYASIQKLLSLPPEFRLYTGHDYPPDARKAAATGAAEEPFSTVKDQMEHNKHVKQGTEKQDFVKWRSDRDSTLKEPRLIHYALQVNIRGGRLPKATEDGLRLLHVPINIPESGGF